MTSLRQNDVLNLTELAPVLDRAVDELPTEDRTAIMLRFFEQLDFRAVGESLGSSEDAAHKRVGRALEKLHVSLGQRGVTLSFPGLAAALTAGAVTVAPAELSAAVAGAALASAAGVVGSGAVSASTMVNVMTIGNLKAGVIGVAIAAAAGTPGLLQHTEKVRLEEANLKGRSTH